MKILVIEPGKQPYIKDVENKLEALQEIVGGYIETIHPYTDPVVLVCNEEGRLLGLEPNRFVEHYGVIVGTFFICGHGIDDFTGLSEDMAEKYKQWFTIESKGEDYVES